MAYRYLDSHELLEIHAEILRSTGGAGGVLFPGNLELCVEIPKRDEFGYAPYRDVFQKAASLLYEINKLHPFVDGNKRTAYSATSTFLELNAYEMEAKIEEAVDLSLRVAQCNSSIIEVTTWVKTHAKHK